MLWCQVVHNIGLFKHKLKSAPKCIVRSQCTPVPVPDRQTDRQTNERHSNSTTIRSMSASRAKNCNWEYTITDHRIRPHSHYLCKHLHDKSEQWENYEKSIDAIVLTIDSTWNDDDRRHMKWSTSRFDPRLDRLHYVSEEHDDRLTWSTTTYSRKLSSLIQMLHIIKRHSTVTVPL